MVYECTLGLKCNTMYYKKWDFPDLIITIFWKLKIALKIQYHTEGQEHLA